MMYRILKFIDCMMVNKKHRNHNQRETLTPPVQLRVSAHAVIISHCQEIERSPEDLRKLKNLGATVVQFPVSSCATVDIAMMAARVPSTMVLEGTEHNVRPIIAGTSYLAYLIMCRDHFVWSPTGYRQDENGVLDNEAYQDCQQNLKFLCSLHRYES